MPAYLCVWVLLPCLACMWEIKVSGHPIVRVLRAIGYHLRASGYLLLAYSLPQCLSHQGGEGCPFSTSLSPLRAPPSNLPRLIDQGSSKVSPRRSLESSGAPGSTSDHLRNDLLPVRSHPQTFTLCFLGPGVLVTHRVTRTAVPIPSPLSP